MRAQSIVLRLVIAIAVTASPAFAQPAAAIGKPLPSPDLPAGTLVVRVVAGEPFSVATGVAVTVKVDGKPIPAQTTDAVGRATFTGIAQGVRVEVSVTSKDPKLGHGELVMGKEGVRMMLSTEPWRVPDVKLPTLRDRSGKVTADGPAGRLEVQLTYDRTDPKPAGVAVTLVAYTADNRVSIASSSTTAAGNVAFDQLDTSGATAYFLLAQLPRNGKPDRLTSEVWVPDAVEGAKVILASHPRSSKAPPIDLDKDVVPAGKVKVTVDGVPDPAAAIELVDAKSGAVVVRGTPKPGERSVLLTASATATVYAQTTARGEIHRSRPFQLVADRGASVTVLVAPRVVPRAEVIASVEGTRFAVRMSLGLENNSWHPYRLADPIALPTGARDPVLGYDDDTRAKLTPKGVVFHRPLPPGGADVLIGFGLPMVDGRVKWSWPLPLGLFESSVRVVDEPGVKLDLPAGIATSRRTVNGIDYLASDKITLKPNQTLQFAVTAPKLPPALAATAAACSKLDPDRTAPLRNQPAPALSAPQLDGRPFVLSSLRGKAALVTFTASWNGMKRDRETLPKLVAAVGKQIESIVVVSDPKADAQKVFPDRAYRVVLDTPQGDAALGPITGSWGITAVPETAIIDKKGTIRFWLINQRDWSTADAIACVRALAAE